MMCMSALLSNSSVKAFEAESSGRSPAELGELRVLFGMRPSSE